MTLLIALPYLLKSICAVIVIFFVTQVRGLTPKWPWDWRHHMMLEKALRACICIAWLVIMIENNFIAFSVLLGEQVLEMPGSGTMSYILQQVAGVLILAHFAWIAWRANHRGGYKILH